MRDNGDLARDARKPAPTHVLPVDPDVSVGRREGVRSRSVPFWRQARRTLVRRWDILAIIAVGGALGSLARWGLGEAFATGRGGFPWATFAENVTGGFVLGVLMVFVIDVWPPSRHVRPFFGVGVLGGFTTFSTYVLDTRTLIAAHHELLAATYLFATLAAGLAAVWLGIAVARLVIARAIRRRQRRHDVSTGTRADTDPSTNTRRRS